MFRRKLTLYAFLASSAVLVGSICFWNPEQPSLDPGSAYGQLAKVNRVAAAYLKWADQHEKNGGDHSVVMSLGWSKAL